MIFHNREQAAQLLADKLTDYKGKNPLVLAIPRGAVPMAKIIAETLGGEFDVVLVRKIGAPGHAEFAVGAVDETGWVYLGDDAKVMGLDSDRLEAAKQAELVTIRRRRQQYSPLRPPHDPQGLTHCARSAPTPMTWCAFTRRKIFRRSASSIWILARSRMTR